MQFAQCMTLLVRRAEEGVFFFLPCKLTPCAVLRSSHMLLEGFPVSVQSSFPFLQQLPMGERNHHLKKRLQKLLDLLLPLNAVGCCSNWQFCVVW